jgi:hypothetical protein
VAIRRKPGTAEKGGFAVVVPVCPERCGADAFHATGEVDPAASGGYKPGGKDDGIQAGTALAVNGEDRNRHGEARLEGRKPRHVAPAPDCIAYDDVCHVGRLDAGFGQQRREDRREKFMGPEVPEQPVGAANGRA